MNRRVHTEFFLVWALLATALPPPLASAAPRPHLFQNDQCADCHYRAERAGSFLSPKALRQDVDHLCFACHEPERLGVGHRVGMAPSMRVPADLPLDAGGRVTCATCHALHAAERANRWLLRRPPGPAFCGACHRDGLPPREPPAVTVTFPPAGAVLASPEVVVAGTATAQDAAEVRVGTALGAVVVPLVGGDFAAKVRLRPGANTITVDAGHGKRVVSVVHRPGAEGWTPHLTSDTDQCAVCHRSAQTAGYFRSAPTADLCHQCHDRVDRLPHAHPPAALGECTACHDPHGTSASRPAARAGARCVGCHDETGAARHLLAVGVPGGATACGDCHDPHQSTRPALTTSTRGSLALAVELLAPPPALGGGPADPQVSIEGFATAEDPGRPRLPEKIVALAVPPGADAGTARLRILEREASALPGTHEIAPAPPLAAWVDGRPLTDWGPGRAIDRGRDRAAYRGDAPWPREPLALLGRAGLGDLDLVRLAYRPVQYRAADGTLTFTRRVVAEVEFSPGTPRPGLRDLAPAGGRAATAGDLGVANRTRARAWRRAGALSPAPGGATADGPAAAAADAGRFTAAAGAGGADYLVVTTKAIAGASGALAEFAAHKAARGLTVRVVTEDDYGPAPVGAPRAHAIRAWLQANTGPLGARYALLAGNPHPESGDVPMLRAWPRRGATTNTGYLDAPTDAYYADLSGAWDLDGDGYYGEFRGDAGDGGVDFAPELFVGRVPVYPGGVPVLDAVLRKTMAYESAPGPLDWRRSALLPMSFSDPNTDGAWLAEQMKSGYLEARGFAPWTLYQLGSAGGRASEFRPNAELRGGTVAERWGTVPYGVVAWWAHGSASRSLVGYTGAWDGDLLAAPVTALDDSAPAIVFQTACLNGYPESETNLGYNLLKRGAVATVAASRVSWYAIGQKDFRNSTTNAGIGYRFVRLLSAGESAGRALGLVRGDPGAFTGSDTVWMNLMDFNLYGDPAAALFPGPVLQVTVDAVALTAAAGEAGPVAAAFAVSSGDASVDVAASTAAAWLSVAPASARTPATVTVGASPAGLAPGVYDGAVDLASAGAGNAPLSLPVRLTVTDPGRIVVRVLDPLGAPLAGAAVSLRGTREHSGATDAAGACAFSPLPPGDYTVAVSGTGFVFARSEQACSLAAGEALAVRFVARSYALRGRVTDAAARPLPKATLRLYDASGVLLRQTVTDATGAYALRKLGPGDYRLRALLKGWRFLPSTLAVTVTDASLAGQDFTGTRR